MNVVVDGVTRLERISEKNGVSKFAEVYYGWKTGNTFEASSSASANEVAEAFKAKQGS